DPVRSRAPAAGLRDLDAPGLRARARVALRAIQDHGVGDRHVVDPVGDSFPARFPRGRRVDRGSRAEDARGAPPRGPTSPRPLLRVPRPRRPRLLAFPRSEAPCLRPRPRVEIRRRRREVLRHGGRDRRRDRARSPGRRRSSRALGPRLRDVATFRELRLVARRKGIPRPEGGRAAAESRGALFARGILGSGRLVALARLRDGSRRSLREPAGAREGRARGSGSGIRGAPRGAHSRPGGGEGEGLVAPGPEYEALREELTRGLLELTDPATGERAVSRVFKREDVYRRYAPRLIPDLIVANRPGYRVSWQ